MEKFDALIIGAGVVGLAIADALSQKLKNILVVERHAGFGQETSSRNSEVIHGGMYYPTGSLKAKLCVEGRRMLYEFCQENNISFKKTGKMIVATEAQEREGLNAILDQGVKNGVEGLSFLTKKQIVDLEPNVSGIEAVYSKETGIVDSHQVMQRLADSAENKDALIAYHSQVEGISKQGGGYQVKIKNNDEITVIVSEVVINSAGLDSDNMAQAAGIDIAANQYQLYYCKGQYFRVASRASKYVKGLVYPVPRPKSGGLGIHVTPDLSGNLRLGPDDHYSQNRNQDYSVEESAKSDFYSSAAKFLPFLKEEDLSPDTAGIRPKLQPKGGAFRDFVISEESDKNLPGFINLIGIESPGLTAALAIAKMVHKLMH